MAVSNRDRIGKMFELLAPALDDYISSVIGSVSPAAGADWASLVAAKDGNPKGKTYDPLDPQVSLRMLTESGITQNVKRGWFPFDDTLGHTGKNYAGELRDVRNTLAHDFKKGFSDDDCYRALDTAERLLKLIGAVDVADEVNSIKVNLRRVTADKQDKKVLKLSIDNPESSGLRPWREVLPPHDDVATGNFHASEFAADLYKVATGDESDADYAQPVDFFKRTYLTDGLKDLIGRAVRRLSGDDNAPPVINLQTNFGGGKTHSMLALWHIAAGLPLGKFPQDTQDLLESVGYQDRQVNRVALVGNHLSTTGTDKEDGTRVNTMWGELAWQLGGRPAYDLVADADAKSVPPGEALHELLKAYSPAVILIDEWVAYARTLVDRNDLAAGTFDDQFTFAQSLTEAVKGTPGVLLALSIPASEAGGSVDDIAPGTSEEVGGANGLEALKRLQNAVRRLAEQWQPASSTEAYHIVKQRLFTQPDSEGIAHINSTAKAFREFYTKNAGEFPNEAKELAYESRLKETYPIHPELFDTLYEEWSTLDRFQRTRGVLRLMSNVIHALWVGEDSSPLIMPGSIPLADSRVNSDLTQYLADNWKAVINADVDGEGSEPAKIDTEKPVFGQRSLTKRLARTVFFGAAPTVGPGSQNKGISTQRVFLGTAVPGDIPGNFHSALHQLGDRAQYFYSGNGNYWYDLKPNITRVAKDQAERVYIEDVWAEVIDRLQGQARERGEFVTVHVGPESNADIPDTQDAKLVILHPKVAHKRNAQSDAIEFAGRATEFRGSSPRTYRNSVVFLAADESRRAELESAVRDYLGWSYVLSESAELDLTENQRNQAVGRRAKADDDVKSRLLDTFQWALVPSQPDPSDSSTFSIKATKIEGQSTSLAERTSRKLGNDGDLAVQTSAGNVRIALNSVPQIWSKGHVTLGELWNLYSTYPYMPRLRDRAVLENGIVDIPLQWDIEAFALANSIDQEQDRYVGLWRGEHLDAQHPALSDATLIVKPQLAKEQWEAEAVVPAGASSAEQDLAQGIAASGDSVDRPGGQPLAANPDAPEAVVKRRFFGVKTLRPDSIALDLKNISDEVLAHLRADGAELTVRIEIEAESVEGFDEGKVRTVSENARTLKFDQSGFEEI